MASRCAAHVWIAFACISGNGFTRASARQHACAMVAQTNSRTETDGVSSWQMIKTDDSDAVSRSSCSIEPYDLAVEGSAYVDRGVTFVGTQMPRFSWKLRASGTQDVVGTMKESTRVGKEGLPLRQTAFRIQATGALHGENRWDSGWVESSRTVGIVWGGDPLLADTRVHWSLRVRDAAGTEALGASVGPAFHVSLTSLDDWKGANWITSSNHIPSNSCAFYAPSPPPLMRVEFNLSSAKTVHTAVLHVVGLGWSQVFMNGHRVGQNELDPALTTYNRTVLYSSFEVADLLLPPQDSDNGQIGSTNAIGITVGNGWFNQLPFKMFGSWKLRETMTVGPPRAMLLLSVLYTDGSTTVVSSGTHWSCATVGPRTHNNLYFGEAYDSRLEARIAGWASPGFSESTADWHSCERADDSVVSVENVSGWMPPIPRLQFAPPVRITARWHPIAAWKLEGSDSFVLDFGRELVGWLEFSIPEGRPGEAVEAVFAERLAIKDGRPYLNGDVDASSTYGPGSVGNWCAPGSGCESMWGECTFSFPPAGRINGAQTITYIQKSGKQSYRGAFSFHVFRYVRVSGYPLEYGAEIPLSHFTALRLHTDNRPAVNATNVYDGRPEHSSVLSAPPSATEEPASFQSSVELLNEIDMLADVAFRSNWIGIQSDCPGRERLGYGGDMMTSAEAGIYMFDATSFYAKRAMDYADARRPNYGLPETAPFVGINSCLTNPELGKGGLGGSGIAAMPWGSTLAHTLHLLHVHADDNRTIGEHFPVAVGWLSLLEAARRPDGTLHNALGMPGACNGTGEALMGTAFLYQQSTLMAGLSEIVGRPDLQSHYTALANTTYDAFNRVFYNATAGAYSDGLGTTDQSAQIYALGLGLVPEEEEGRVVDALLADVKRANNSFVVDAFSVWLMHCLVELGAGEEVMDWMLSTTYPSYGYFLRNDIITATAMMEHWNTPTDDSSHNHAWLNSVSLFYRSRLLGIMPTGAGWAKIRVRPWLLGRANLTWARGSVSSIRGVVQSSWLLNPSTGAFQLNVSLPANLEAARVHVPVAGHAAGVNSVRPCPGAKAIGSPYSLGGKWFVEYDALMVGAETCTFSSMA